MDFAFTAAQEESVKAAREFANDRLAPRYQAREREASIEREIRLEMGAEWFHRPGNPRRSGRSRS